MLIFLATQKNNIVFFNFFTVKNRKNDKNNEKHVFLERLWENILWTKFVHKIYILNYTFKNNFHET